MAEIITNGFVKWKVFVWGFGVVLLLFTITFGVLGTNNEGLNTDIDSNTQKIETNAKDAVDFKIFMGATSETLKNIDKNLSEIKEELKNKR